MSVITDCTILISQILNATIRRNTLASFSKMLSSCSSGCLVFAGSVFIDFGDEFVVEDTDGNEPAVAVIDSIDERRTSLKVTCVKDESHSMQIFGGDTVRFTEVCVLVRVGIYSLCHQLFSSFIGQ